MTFAILFTTYLVIMKSVLISAKLSPQSLPRQMMNDGNASVGENMDEENLFDDHYAFWTEGSLISAQEQSRLHSPNTHYTSLDKQMLADVSVYLNRLASKSNRLIGNNTTNAAEAWMPIRSKFDGGKFNNLCNRGS